MKSRTSVMVSIVLAMLVASLDSTIMNTTMPVIAKELGRFDLYAWSFASYMIASTILSPVAGRLSDLFGRKKYSGLELLLFNWFDALRRGKYDDSACSFPCGSRNRSRVYGGLSAIIAGDLFPVEKRGKFRRSLQRCGDYQLCWLHF